MIVSTLEDLEELAVFVVEELEKLMLDEPGPLLAYVTAPVLFAIEAYASSSSSSLRCDRSYDRRYDRNCDSVCDNIL